MTTNSSTLTQQLLTPAPRVRTGLPADSLRFDRWFTVLATLFMLGIYIDGWAHNNLAELIEKPSIAPVLHGLLSALVSELGLGQTSQDKHGASAGEDDDSEVDSADATDREADRQNR